MAFLPKREYARLYSGTHERGYNTAASSRRSRDSIKGTNKITGCWFTVRSCHAARTYCSITPNTRFIRINGSLMAYAVLALRQFWKLLCAPVLYCSFSLAAGVDIYVYICTESRRICAFAFDTLCTHATAYFKRLFIRATFFFYSRVSYTYICSYFFPFRVSLKNKIAVDFLLAAAAAYNPWIICQLSGVSGAAARCIINCYAGEKKMIASLVYVDKIICLFSLKILLKFKFTYICISECVHQRERERVHY